MQKRASTDGTPEHNKENAAAAKQDLRQLIISHVRFLLTESHKIITSQDVFLAAVEMPVSCYANFTFGFHNSFPHPYDYVLGAFLHLSVNSLYHEAVSTFNNIRPIHIRPSGGDCLVRYLAVLVAICFAWIIDQLSWLGISFCCGKHSGFWLFFVGIFVYCLLRLVRHYS
ncbi:hypothetical protein Vi05172_g10963 [Venturia inaequalis]|nr:hypothetical protein Vi05172_g10963 [Venturia inaequalis]